MFRKKRRKRKRRKSRRRKFRLKFGAKQKKILKAAGIAVGFLAVVYLVYTLPPRTKNDLLKKARSFYSGMERSARTGTAAVREQLRHPKPPRPGISRGGPAPDISATRFPSEIRERTPFSKQAVRPGTTAVQSHLAFLGKPKIAIVIDDIGNTLEQCFLLKQLGNRVTYAIMPLLPYSRIFDAMANNAGAEVILHLPMESLKNKYPGPGEITGQMSDARISYVLAQDLASVPHRVGVNNHMGSLGTEDPAILEKLFKELKRRGFFFLDSYTTDKSVALDVGRWMGLPVLRRDVFLDTVDDKSAIRERVRELARRASENGSAVGIGHYRPNTLEVLAEEVPRLEREGFQLVKLSQLARK